MKFKTKSWLDAYTQIIIKQCWWVIAFSLIIAIAAAAGAYKLRVTNEYQAFFEEKNQELVAFERVQNTFSRSDNILLMLSPESGDVFTPDTMQAIIDLTEKSWLVPFVRRVDSLSNFQHSYSIDDDIIIEDLFTSVDKDNLENIQRIALNEPLLVDRLVSPTGQVTGVNLTIDLDAEFDVIEVVQYVRKMVGDLEAEYPHLEVKASGIIMLNNSLGELILTDILTLIPLVYIAVALGVAYYLRSFYLTIATAALVTLSISSAMGIAGWMGITLTPPSSSVPPIIMTLAVADCIHILITYQQKIREGMTKNEAIYAAIDLNITPVLLTSVTTALGFLTLNFSDSPPFRDLGNMTAIGVIFAFVFSMTFLPAMLAVRKFKMSNKIPKVAPKMLLLANFVINNRRTVLISSLTISATLAVFIPNNRLNDNFVEYFDKDTNFRKNTESITDKLTGIYFAEYALDSGQTYGVTQPDYLSKVERFGAWLKEQPEVIHVNSIVDIIRKLNLNLHGDDAAYYKLPDNSKAIAQYLLLYEMSLQNGLDLNNQINISKSSSRLIATLRTLSTPEILAFEERVANWMESNIPEMKVGGVSPSIMFAHISLNNIQSMLTGTALALVLISLVLILPLRSLSHGALTLVSNILPAAIAFGIWSFMVGNISLGVSVTIAMTLGIVVDDTIHLMVKYLRARREMKLTPEDAVRYAFQTVGVALVATTTVLLIGFFILAFSDFQVNSHLSIVSALTISAALFVDFLIIPPLLIAMDSRKSIGGSQQHYATLNNQSSTYR